MAVSSEAVSRTTFGGCTLDDLHRGSKNYVCDASCLVNLVGKDSKKAKEELKDKLDELFQDLELQTERRVKKYYIGKTFIKRRRNPNSRRTFAKFDPMDPSTWKKNGISSRWGCHKKMEYGRDGLVVLAAVTKDSVPQQCRHEVHQEQYALALEQMLLHHYKLDIGDERLDNDTFTAGGPDGGKSIAYAIYVTFTLDIQTQDTSLPVPVIVNTSASSVPRQQINAEIPLGENDALPIVSVNSPHSIQLNVWSMVESVCIQLLLEKFSHYSISSTLNRDIPQLHTSSAGERLNNRLVEIDETQQNISSTNCFLYCPLGQIMMEESLGNELVHDNSLTENSILLNMEQIPETVSFSSSPPLLSPRLPAMIELAGDNHPGL